ncbi:probable methyltransferase BMT2 homolog [Aedes aegypti]|uniref:S-adenosylmethionine sensor upstream of mTORC1 n=1 Tax=Aedes aegypti TaxID=7159 RepID=A0A6I8U0H6_AEDAE|nr:probable methyltransferase BMT2 homolog [Aedes aegypti]
MASEEQLALSGLIKSVHQQLRDSSKEAHPDQVWREHLQNEDLLKRYAEAMRTLATCYWDKTMEVSCKKDNSRIEWVVNSCRDYFLGARLLNLFRDKDDKVMKALNENYSYHHQPYDIHRVRLLDVGSCYNPFSSFAEFEVTAIDIAPAHETVKYCDFLEVPLSQIFTNDSTSSISSLPLSYFDAVVFSLLLEYMPSSDQRLQCCQKAYDVLKPEGILLVITPDSRHQGANARLMKNWRFTFGLMGFTRIKIEKLEHVTCMVFRKSIFKEVSERWCRIHKEDYMEPVLNIPQDFKTDTLPNGEHEQEEHVEKSVEDVTKIKEMFGGLPFVDDEMN